MDMGGAQHDKWNRQTNNLVCYLPLIDLIGIHFYKNKQQNGKAPKSGTSIRKERQRHTNRWKYPQNHGNIHKEMNE